jgi:trigger factor
MTDTLTTILTELPQSRVRLQVRVPASEIEKSLQRKARELGRQLKLPGFRKGKIPPPLIIQRLGREVVLDEAIRDSLSGWYVQAIKDAGILPVGDPKLDLGELPSETLPLEFSIEIGVLPTAKLGDYKGLEVGRREPLIGEDEIDQEVEKLRERLAKLESIERQAQIADFVVIDYVGSIDGEPFQGGAGRDQLVELGGGNLIAGFEEGLVGAGAGESRTVEVTFPEDYANEALAGKDASFEVTVKDIKVKELPALDEEFAADLGFDTEQELREDITRRLTEVQEAQIQSEFRQAALDAAVAKAHIDLPEDLVQARAKEMWESMLHSLSHRGISREAYLQFSSQSEADVLAEITPDARQALLRESLTTAVIAAESISPSEDDLLEVITPTAEREGVEPQKLLADLQSSGRIEDIRKDLAARQAVELIAEAAKPIPLEQAQAREKLWTPEQDEPQTAATGGLWTPES